MTREISFRWSGDPAPPAGASLVLTDDPLAEAPTAWFEDYFDAVARFPGVYRRAKEVSVGWTESPAMRRVTAAGVPILESFEHHVHSFWMQVERDRELAASLLERESRGPVRLSGRAVDIAVIAACRFDPGLFELTVAIEAGRRGIPVIGGMPRPRPDSGSPSAVRRAVTGCIDRFRTPGRGIGGAFLLASPSALRSIGQRGIEAFGERGLRVAGTGLDTDGPFPSLAELCAGKVRVRERLAVRSGAWRSFGSITRRDWETAFPGMGEIGALVARRLLEEHLWAEGFRLLLLDRLVGERRPAGLLVLYDHGLSEAGIVALARNRGIPTVTLQHGLANDVIPGYLPLKADRFACWGEAERDLLARQGMAPDRIAVTGCPRFDDQWDGPPPEAGARGPLRVLVATQGVFASVDWSFALTRTERIIRALASLPAGDRGPRYTLRLHPNESLHPSAESLAGRAGIRLTKGVPLASELAGHDVVVTQFSTVGVEALLAGRPLVAMNWCSGTEVIPFAASGVAEPSRGPEDLAAAAERARDLAGSRKAAVAAFLARHLGGPRAAERLAALFPAGTP